MHILKKSIYLLWSAIKIFWAVVKHIFFPELMQNDYDIIADEEIRKMRRERAATEYIRSRRRINEYAELVDASFKKKYKIIAFSAFVIFTTSLIICLLNSKILKLGDAFAGILGFVTYLFSARSLVLHKPKPFSEEKIIEYSLPKLKKSLRTALKCEWQYMDFHNKRLASAAATLMTYGLGVIMIVVSTFKHPEKKILNDVVSLFQGDCETLSVPFISLNFNLCNYITGRFFYISLLFFVVAEFASIFSGLPGSGKFFSRQSFRPNYIASTYLDNLSLSVLSPSQHEAI